jgi:hypothetical protein
MTSGNTRDSVRWKLVQRGETWRLSMEPDCDHLEVARGAAKSFGLTWVDWRAAMGVSGRLAEHCRGKNQRYDQTVRAWIANLHNNGTTLKTFLGTCELSWRFTHRPGCEAQFTASIKQGTFYLLRLNALL